MGIPILIASATPQLVTACRGAFGLRCRIATRLQDDAGLLHGDVILVTDLTNLLHDTGTFLIGWSRRTNRGGIVVVAHDQSPANLLALVVADAYVALPVTPEAVVEAVHCSSGVQLRQAAAYHIRDQSKAPYPLSKFLAEIILTDCNRVQILAHRHRLKGSTLRNQWRRFRSDPSVRLEDLMKAGKQCADVRVLNPHSEGVRIARLLVLMLGAPNVPSSLSGASNHDIATVFSLEGRSPVN